MADDLSVDSVLEFVSSRGGKVKNSVLVPHFKKFFNNPQTKDKDRQKFKEIVNTVATVKVENGEKFISLKKKYRTSSSAKSSKSEDDEVTVVVEESTPSLPDDLNTPQGGASGAESKRGTSTSTDEARISGSCDTYSMTSSVNDEPTKSSDDVQQKEVNDTTPSSGGDDVIFAKPLPPAPPARENMTTTSEKTTSSAVAVEAPGSGSLGRRNKTKKPSESPIMSERHSARVGRIKKVVDSSPSVASQPTEGGGGRRSNRPMSIYQGSLPGSFERVRQNFMNKPKNLEDSKKQNSLTNSQASLSSKEIDQDEDYDRNSPAFVLDANDKQWILSACRGDLVEMRKLLDEDETLADKKDFIMGYTALHWAAKKGNRDMAQILIEMSVQLSPKSNGGYTPLHLAAMNGHEEIVTLLLDSGADPNVRDFSGRQPIHYLKSIALPLKRVIFGNQHQQTGTKEFAAGLRPRLDSIRKSSHRLSTAIGGGLGQVGKMVISLSNEELARSQFSEDKTLPRTSSFKQSSRQRKNKGRKKINRPVISVMSMDEQDSAYLGESLRAYHTSLSSLSLTSMQDPKFTIGNQQIEEEE